MPNPLSSGQFFWTTADVEQHRFMGAQSELLYGTALKVTHSVLAPGMYRVICGELFEEVDGYPPGTHDDE